MSSLKAYTYLFADEPRVYEYTRVDGKTISVRLPLAHGSGWKQEYLVPFDERDLRTLLVFDGDIPWNGLPRTADVAHREVLRDVGLNVEHVRKLRPFEEDAPETIKRHFKTGQAVLILCRNFLLMRNGTALIRRYRPESFAAMYALVQVTRHQGSAAQVVWRNSSS